MRIDAHQHFWKPERNDYGWLTPELDTLHRDFLPADLLPLLEKNNIDKTILVQAAPTEAETYFMLELAEDNDFIAGVVGWTDFDYELASENIAKLAKNRKLVGLRPMVQDLPDDDWLARKSLTPAFEAMVAHDLVFDALLLPRHLPRLFPVLDRHPDLTVVIDHAAKPTLRDGVEKSWFDNMAQAARYQQVYCKLSGLVTEARENWTVGDLVPVVDHLFQQFGPERILWGSDWPVLTLAGSYDRWMQATEQLVSSLSAEQKSAVLGGNAKKVYL